MPSIARWRRGVGLVGLVLALAPAAGTAAAEVPRGVVGADFRVGGGSAATDDLRPAVAWNQADDQYLVVWQDERLAFTRGADIYGQRFTAAGAPLGANFRISGGSAINSDRDPAVAWNQASREYLVVWEDLRNEGAGKGYDIYGQRVGANGALIGSNLRITGVAHATSYAPAVAWNQAHNQYLVVWHDGRSYPTRGYDIYGQRVSAAGALLGGNFRVSGGSATGDDLHPAVSWNPANNQYLVVWHDGRSYA
ncbi:MAG: hypothetical protein FJW79_12820, partial [Actinobacteria bacterium]|nr:hypothetical protein [Actinomycetota bacterium]